MTDIDIDTGMDAILAVQSADDAVANGLTDSEWTGLVKRIGRRPNRVELSLYGAMWSEHCSYKSSRRHLAKLPVKGARIIQGPGENAGVIDIGDGQAAVFKMESHNHPSFIEPYQGAATGVGGILRDVFTMGARPVALINALRFGDPGHDRTRNLIAGVVAGIGGYGNCVGVPTLAGETEFNKGYNGNILVNAMAVGIADQDKIFYARGARPGQQLVYVGARTGRDGIHGATMASAEFSEDTEAARPTVQVGDPFTGKRLIEACLELMASGAIAAIQDMGAAGLTSSAIEMADKGNVGIKIDLDRVPQRENGMNACEIMLSESQERMLMVLEPGRVDEARAIFGKYGLEAETIGMTTDTGHIVLAHNGRIVCDLPVASLAGDAPVYERPWTEPAISPALDINTVSRPENVADTLVTLMSCPNMASRRWIWEQYDRHVMGDTLHSSQNMGNAAIVRIHGTDKALAMTSDCTPRYVSANPLEGGKQAVAEAYRNLSAVGAVPIAITNNLNFGNPERPEIMGQIVRALDGMAMACRALDFPVTGGNVSLYNETDGVAIPPTPVIGALGLIDKGDKMASLHGMQAGDALLVIGETEGHMGASLYTQEIARPGRAEIGQAPPVDLNAEKQHADFIRAVIRADHVNAVHDISDGGIACAAAEMALVNGLGFDIAAHKITGSQPLPEPLFWTRLFSEDQGRYLVTAPQEQVAQILNQAQALSIHVCVIGMAGPGDDIVITPGGPDTGRQTIALKHLRQAHEAWLPAYMDTTDL